MMHLLMLSVVEEMPATEVLGAEEKAPRAQAKSARILSRRARRLVQLVAPRAMVTMKIYKRALMESHSKIPCIDLPRAPSVAT